MYALIGAAAVVALWWILAVTVFAENNLVPTPAEVLRQYRHDGWDFYWRNAKATIEPALIGYGWGNGLAIVCACLIILVPALELGILRLAIATYCLPIISIGPILVILMTGNGPRIVLAALSCFFVTLIGVLLGLRSADATSLELVQGFGGNRWAQLAYVRSRAALPSLFAALRIAAPYALLGVMVGEYLGAERGLGVAMLSAQRTLQVERVWAIAFVASAVAGIGYLLATLASRALVRWPAPTISIASSTQRVLRGAGGRKLARPVATTLVSFGVLLLIWELTLRATGLDPFIAKGPADVWHWLVGDPAAGENRSILFDSLGKTLLHAGVGYVVGLGAALALASAFVLAPVLERSLLPVAITLQTIPLVAMVPLIAIVFGRGLAGVAVVCGMVTFFPTLVYVSVAMRATSPAVLLLFRAYHASKTAAFAKAILPTSVPALFASARIAAPAAMFGALLSEWLVTGDGLGYLMLQGGVTGKYVVVWAATALITLVSIAWYALVATAERRAVARFSMQAG